jgi:hypothetical protein
MQGWEAVPVAAPAARVGAADGAAFQLRINATAPVYGYPAGAALCLSLDLCQSHGPGTSWGGAAPPAFAYENIFCMGLLYGHAGRLTAANGGFRLGQ